MQDDRATASARSHTTASARAAATLSRRQFAAFFADDELQDYIRGNPAAAEQTISDWLAIARARGKLPLETAEG